MDAFAVSVTSGLTIKDINKKRTLFIALTFGVMQALMPLTGFFLIELVEFLAGEIAGESVGLIVALIVTWLAFSLLLFIGGKMIVEAIISLKSKKEEEQKEKLFSFKQILIYGVATSIDALATGIAFHTGLSISGATPWYQSIWLHVSIILLCTFAISLLGLLLGKQISRLLKGKFEITEIIGGIILITLAIWIILSHYLSL